MLPVAVAKGDFRATNWLAARQQLDYLGAIKSAGGDFKMQGQII
jgi:hypothetical protein